MEELSMSGSDVMAVSAPDTAAPDVNAVTHAPVVAPRPINGRTATSAGANGHSKSNGASKSDSAQHKDAVDSESDEDEEMPLARKPPAPSKRVAYSDSSSDDRPLNKKARMSSGGTGGAATKKRRVVQSDSEESEAGPSSSSPVMKKEAVVQSNGNSVSKPPSKKPAAASSPMSSESDDDKPLAAKPNTNGNGKGNRKRNGSTGAAKPKSKGERPETESEEEESDADNAGSSFASSEEEKPLAKKAKSQKPHPAKPRKSGSSTPKPRAGPVPKTKAKKNEESEDNEDDADDVPLAKKGNGKAEGNGEASKPKTKPRTSKVKQEVLSEDDEVPVAKKGTKRKGKEVEVKRGSGCKVKREKKAKQEEEDEETYKWWEDAQGDGYVKWNSLEHRGVLFPPPYVTLPKGVRMKYDGTALTLPPESEEVAGFFGAMLETDHAQDAKFRENFFRDFKEMLQKYPPKEDVKVKSLEKCDFKPMFEHFEAEKEKKKAMTKEEKKAVKEAKEELEKPYLFALVDGRKEKLGNFRAEPPGLFRGRGEHPRKGTLKHRLRPEDILLNIGKDAPVPVPNIPGEWQGVTHDNTVTWLAHWKENVNGASKYVFLAAGSSWKGQSDRSKFEKARELIKHVDKIRADYQIDLKSKVMADRQRATALYFIDKLALRAGNEKGEDEADTVGCCSLRYEHVTLEPPNKVIFDFLGKDSMRFHQEVEVQQQVFKNIKIFKQDKDKGDDLFDRLNTGLLNQYLASQMKGLTAKVFRTYNASWTFQIQLQNTPKDGTIQEKIAAYNTANRDVAILCNHQKTVSKGFAESYAKAGDKIRALKYQRMKLRFQLFTLEPKAKKRHPELKEDESDMDEEFMDRHEEDLLEKALQAAEKKWERDNVKLEEGQEEKKPLGVLKDRQKEIKEEFSELAKERKTRNVEPRKGVTEEKLVDQISKMDDRIAAAKVSLGDRDKTKDVALGTSKINYIVRGMARDILVLGTGLKSGFGLKIQDPRLTVAWARKYEVPLEKLFSKALREKFPWAEAEADAHWVF